MTTDPYDALKPFADFAQHSRDVPDAAVVSLPIPGSTRQLTMRDCNAAADCLAARPACAGDASALIPGEVVRSGLMRMGFAGDESEVRQVLGTIYDLMSDDTPPPPTILVHVDVALGPQGPVQTDHRVVPMTFVPMPGITLGFGDAMEALDDSLSVQAQIVRIDSDGATHVHLLCTKIGAAVIAASPSMLERLPPVQGHRAPGSRLIMPNGDGR